MPGSCPADTIRSCASVRAARLRAGLENCTSAAPQYKDSGLLGQCRRPNWPRDDPLAHAGYRAGAGRYVQCRRYPPTGDCPQWIGLPGPRSTPVRDAGPRPNHCRTRCPAGRIGVGLPRPQRTKGRLARLNLVAQTHIEHQRLQRGVTPERAVRRSRKPGPLRNASGSSGAAVRSRGPGRTKPAPGPATPAHRQRYLACQQAPRSMHRVCAVRTCRRGARRAHLIGGNEN